VITGVHHVGLVVRSLEAAYGFWRERLGLPLLRAAEVPDQGVRAALLACGPVEIELLEPIDPGGGVARFLDRRGQGFHHLCLESDDVAGELCRLQGLGVELIDRLPRAGLAGAVAFLHPRAAAGILVELATPPARTAAAPPAPLRVVSVVLAVEAPGPAAEAYAALFGLPARGLRLQAGETPLVLRAAGAAPPGLAALALAGAPGDPAVGGPGPIADLAQSHGVPLRLEPAPGPPPAGRAATRGRREGRT
jgi:methylmalonyl-CoA epimerase